MKKSPNERRRTLRCLASHLLPHTPLLLLSLLCAAGTVALTLYVPYLIGVCIDGMVYRATDLEALGAQLLRILLLVGLTAVLRFVMDTVNRRITYHTVRDIRTGAMSHLQRVPLSYLDTVPTGDTVSRIITDTDTLAEGLLLGFSQIFTGVLTILGTLACMIGVRWQIALLVALLTPLSLFIARFISGRTHRFFHDQARTQGEQTACIDEMIGQIKLVKSFGREEEACERFHDVNGRLADASLKATFFSSLVNPTTRFVNSVIYAVVALAGALLVLGTDGGLTVGALTCLLAYVNQYTKPFNEISGVIAEFQNALTSADRVFALTSVEAEPNEWDGPVPSPHGEIILRDVSFSYVPERPLIEHLNLHVHTGEHIAIVGPTGCGKTTLINLLMRFYDVTHGSIEVDGEDVRRIPRKALRERFGMVLQDTWLKHASVRENLLYANPGLSDEQMIAATKAVHAHGFICRLSDGYDTVLEEGGGQLSAGQKQLLAIARTMLSDPDILILDEATSSIDTRTERYVSEAFDLLMKGRTTFLVAHRLSTVEHADLILVMREGNIVEQGTHEELLARGGFYHTLYYSQFAAQNNE